MKLINGYVGALVAIVLLSTTPALADPATGFEYVGISSGSTDGDAGLFAMHGLCAATFDKSRMCTSEEIVQTVNPPVLATGFAWAQPILTGTNYNPISMSSLVVEKYYGISFPDGIDCNGWEGGASESGLVLLTDTGQLRVRNCTLSNPVACCAPASSGKGKK